MKPKRSDHYQLGQAHSMSGMPRYKFQDPFLQQEYDKGYNSDGERDSNESALLRELQKQQMPRKDRW
jgi:hypothetical protein